MAEMTTAVATPRIPEDSQRLAARKRLPGNPVMFQQWRNLLFLHWEYSVTAIQATLPKGLFVDTYEGRAYLGVVPFFMQNIRPRLLPAVPGLSNFMELNLRTYVHDSAGVPGVWFYSLDANQWLAVKIARHFFHLPYKHAKMTSRPTASAGVRYESTRLGKEANGMTCAYEYAPGAELAPASLGSLEFFLVERYRLYSSTPDGLWRGAVFHEPYPLCRAEVTAWDEHLLTLDSFTPTGRPPDHIVVSRGVDVSIFPLERARGA